MKPEELLKLRFLRDPATGDVNAHTLILTNEGHLDGTKQLVFGANQVNSEFYHLLESAQFMYFTLNQIRIIAQASGLSGLVTMSETAMQCAEVGIETTIADISLQQELGL